MISALNLSHGNDRDNDTIGEYKLRDIVGTGSFGHVILGVHQQTREHVAIKVLAKDNASDCAIRRISSEVSTMEKAGRECPFIVKLHEVLVGHHHIYLVMEYAAGGELFKAKFKPANDLSTDVGSIEREHRARSYFQQLIIGVQWCHDLGVAHRDIKPQNLLLSLNGVLKIADFGLAATFNPEPSLRCSHRAMRQTMCGSPLYMAPEMLSLRNGGSYNTLATDAWGCGAVLYAMLLGGPPFPASSFSELVSLASRPHVNLKMPDAIPRSLSMLLRALLRFDPKQRFTLPQVAQTEWFQIDLHGTLGKTPQFTPPVCMRPTGMALTIDGMAAHHEYAAIGNQGPSGSHTTLCVPGSGRRLLRPLATPRILHACMTRRPDAKLVLYRRAAPRPTAATATDASHAAVGSEAASQSLPATNRDTGLASRLRARVLAGMQPSKDVRATSTSTNAGTRRTI